MRFLYKLKHGLGALFRRSRKNEELTREIEQHIEMEVADLVAEGMDPKDARAAVLREFGHIDSHMEECRDAWGSRFVENTSRNIRLAMRQLMKRKGTSAVIVLTLA